MRVADKNGNEGVVTVARRNLVSVRWDNGAWSQTLASELHEPSRRRVTPWHVIVAGLILLLGLSVTLGVWR